MALAATGPLAVAVLRGVLPYETDDDELTVAAKWPAGRGELGAHRRRLRRRRAGAPVTAVRVGLTLLGLLSLADALGLLLTDGKPPPVEMAAVGTALGLLSLVLVVAAWRRPRPGLLVGLVLLRVASAATAVPAFVVADVPAIAVVWAGAVVGLTTVGCLLLVPALRRAPDHQQAERNRRAQRRSFPRTTFHSGDRTAVSRAPRRSPRCARAHPRPSRTAREVHVTGR